MNPGTILCCSWSEAHTSDMPFSLLKGTLSPIHIMSAAPLMWGQNAGLAWHKVAGALNRPKQN